MKIILSRACPMMYKYLHSLKHLYIFVKTGMTIWLIPQSDGLGCGPTAKRYSYPGPSCLFHRHPFSRRLSRKKRCLVGMCSDFSLIMSYRRFYHCRLFIGIRLQSSLCKIPFRIEASPRDCSQKRGCGGINFVMAK